MRRFASDIATLVLLVVVVGGIVAVIVVPGDATSKTAIALGVLAAMLGAASFATSPDWDALSDEITRIRQAVESRARSLPPLTTRESRHAGIRRLVMAVTLLVAVALVRSPRRQGRSR